MNASGATGEVTTRRETPRAGNATMLYLGSLTLASVLADPVGLVTIPVLFTLKDHLRLGPETVALFEATTLLPHYLAVFFGVWRDRWRRSGFDDRQCLLVAAPAGALCYLWLAFSTVSFLNLIVTMTIAMVAFQLVDTALQAITTMIGQRQAMTGRLSALTELLVGLGGLAAAMGGGWMARYVSLQTAFLAAAAISGVIFLQAAWKPKSVLADLDGESISAGESPSTLRTAMNHRMVRFTIAIYVLYNFSPGWGTPLFYYLTDHVHISPEAFGTSRAAMYGGNVVATLLYGFYCNRFSLKRLLWWSILANVCPGILFLFVGDAAQAIAVSALLGIFSGFANVALADLLMRVCPVGLEGTASMLCISAFGIAGMVGDLFGAWLFERSGLAMCVAADALATLLIVPLLLRVPAALESSSERVVVTPRAP